MKVRIVFDGEWWNAYQGTRIFGFLMRWRYITGSISRDMEKTEAYARNYAEQSKLAKVLDL